VSCVPQQYRSGEGGSPCITSHTLFHPSACLPACLPASVLCSSDFATVELRDSITVIELSKGVVFCGPLSTFILAPPTGTDTPFFGMRLGSHNVIFFCRLKSCLFHLETNVGFVSSCNTVIEKMVHTYKAS